jgi:hypothetical protein
MFNYDNSSLNLLRMRNVSDKICRENENTHFVFSEFLTENRAVYEIMWKNIVEWGRPQMTLRRMRIACCIPEATDTHTQNTYWFSTATMVARTCLNVKFYLHCPSCFTSQETCFPSSFWHLWFQTGCWIFEKLVFSCFNTFSKHVTTQSPEYISMPTSPASNNLIMCEGN